MPDVSFYILPTDAAHDRDLFTCKLAEKAYRQGIYSFILTESEAHSKIMDDLLWTFRASSFIPHQIFSKNSANMLPQIIISDNPNHVQQGATLINLSHYYPEHIEQFERIMEILDQKDTILHAGRSRYRQYQQAGANLTTHKL
jgi:DNA polymerase III subunit chi